MSCVAGGYRDLCQQWETQFMDEQIAQGKLPFLMFHFDGSPNRMKFCTCHVLQKNMLGDLIIIFDCPLGSLWHLIYLS